MLCHSFPSILRGYGAREVGHIKNLRTGCWVHTPTWFYPLHLVWYRIQVTGYGVREAGHAKDPSLYGVNYHAHYIIMTWMQPLQLLWHIIQVTRCAGDGSR